VLKMLDLFSGIGGFSLAASWTNQIKTVAFCEIDPFCQKVLKKHWPDVPIFDDITRLRGDDIGTADIITGGFPCQPFSCAGKRRGKEDDRFLWPEMLRVISEAKPRWVIGENVAGFINMGLDDCISDLENQGYEVQAFVIPACAVNAPHRRDRVWIVGHSEGSGKCVGQQERMDREVFSQTGRKQGSVNPTSPDSNAFNPGITSESTRTENNDWEALSPCKPDSHAPDTGCRGLEGTVEERWDGVNVIGQDSIITDTNGAGSGTSTSGTDGNGTPCSEEQKLSQSEYSGQDSDAPDSNSGRLQRESVNLRSEGKKSNDEQSMRCGGEWQENWLEVATRLCRVDDGVSNRVDRLKALGNSIVPQVAYQIFIAIVEEGN